MFKVRPQDNVVLESCHGCFQIPMRMGEKRRCARPCRDRGDSPRRDSFQAGFYKPPNETATNHRTEIGKNTGRKSEKLPNGNRKNCRMDIDIRKVYVI